MPQLYAIPIILAITAALVSGPCFAETAPSKRPIQTTAIFFDDFEYADPSAIANGGWQIRTQKGWPGIEGARWGSESLALVDDPDHPGNRILRMTSETDGTSAGTRQAQLCQARKYFQGTYAARVRFTDKAMAGPSDDVVVESFYAASPLEHGMSPNYSELDYEYLPKGGWGQAGPVIFNTSWETVQLTPWKAFNQASHQQGSLAGWHTLVMQVMSGTLHYFVDGQPTARHGGKNYPRVPMSINFNLWFTREGLRAGKEKRIWNEDIDWVLYVKGQGLSPKDVETTVAAYRKAGRAFEDTVPAHQPPLPCPCDM